MPDETTAELLARLNQSRVHPREARRRAGEEARKARAAASAEREADRVARDAAAAAKRKQARRRAERTAQTGVRDSWTRPAGPKRAERGRPTATQWAAPARSDDAWRAYERRWTTFTAQTTATQAADAPIAAADVPWPTPDLVRGRLRDAHARSVDEFTRAYRALALRFHPDKFHQHVGRRMSGDADAAERRACEMFQVIGSVADELVG